MASIAMLVSVSYQALPRSQFLIHRLTKLLLVACRPQRISDDSPIIMYNTQVHELIRFAWNEAPLVDIR